MLYLRRVRSRSQITHLTSKSECRRLVLEASRTRRQLLNRLKKRDGMKCVWCSKELGKRSATLDHVVPQCRGGSDWVGNLMIACSKCNGERGSMSARNFLKERKRSARKVREDVIQKAIQRSRDPLASHAIFEQHLHTIWERRVAATYHQLTMNAGTLT